MAGSQRAFQVRTYGDSTEKKLFTPGPLCTSATVREAMRFDFGSRDEKFMEIVKNIRSELLKVGGVSEAEYTTIPVQGSGTFAVESVITSSVPRGGKLVVISNGHYAQRIAKIARVLEIETEMVEFPETSFFDLAEVERRLRAAGPSVTNVAFVHCETSSGVVNDALATARVCKAACPQATLFVDAMSSLGAVPLDVGAAGIDFIVSSANKCIQGVPGFSFIIARREPLERCKGVARSLSLDMYDQAKGLEASGQFRFTPATQSMAAFNQALAELAEEGGCAARAARYANNRRVLREGMSELGFVEFLGPEHEGYIITSFHLPKDPQFHFETFYGKLADKGFCIYPGKVTTAPTLRIGCIGHLFEEDMRGLLGAMRETLAEMNVQSCAA